MGRGNQQVCACAQGLRNVGKLRVKVFAFIQNVQFTADSQRFFLRLSMGGRFTGRSGLRQAKKCAGNPIGTLQGIQRALRRGRGGYLFHLVTVYGAIQRISVP